MRHRWLWTSTAIVVALAASVAMLPRQDPYGYLRALNPKVTHDRTEASAGNPSVPTIEFEFNDSFARIRGLLIAHGARSDGDGAITMFTMADGKDAMLVSEPTRKPPTSLTIFDQEPTWFEARVQALKHFFHVD